MVTHKEIPNGYFCYGPGGRNGYRCPHWEAIERDGQMVVRARCNLLGVEDEEPQALTLLWDQVKLCKFNCRNPHEEVEKE